MAERGSRPPTRSWVTDPQRLGDAGWVGMYQRRKAACKPSSVPDSPLVYAADMSGLHPDGGPGGDHLSSPDVAIGVKRPTQGQAPSGLTTAGVRRVGPGTLGPSIRPCSEWGLPCLRCHHRSGELLPHHFTLIPIESGRYVSVALSVGSPRPTVSGHPTRRSSDFPPRLRVGAVARPPCAS